MATTQTGYAPRLPQDSSRYEYAIPDYETHPDVYSRTWILLEWVGTGKRVLELGCSTGYMSKYLAEKRNCCVTGIEVDASAAQQARNFCEEVLTRDLNGPDWAVGIPKNAFEVILMADVLEHLIDPVEVLLQIPPLLRPGGKLVICLPNVVHWITRLKILFGRFDYEPGGTLDHTHLRFYTLQTARELIEGAGYTVTKFYPAIGGRMSGHARPLWHCLVRWFPGLFGWQFLYEAKPNDENGGMQILD